MHVFVHASAKKKFDIELHFVCQTNAVFGVRYIDLYNFSLFADELTKNNWENDKGLVSGAMPESPVETKRQYKNLQLTEI
jgi:hypothetical protein